MKQIVVICMLLFAVAGCAAYSSPEEAKRQINQSLDGVQNSIKGE